MALPSNVGHGTVTGQFSDAAGNPIEGTVTFTPSPKRLLAATADPPATILPRPVTVELADGAFSVDLAATDDIDANPTGWTYSVKFAFSGVLAPGFDIEVPEGGAVDLTGVSPVASSDGVTITQGPPGLVQSIVPGDGVTVDDADPANPVVSAIGGGEGSQGEPGADGASAYEVAVEAGFEGTESEWLASLVGPAGPAGPAGADGQDGAPGEQGPQGPQGPQGERGPAGADGEDGHSPVITWDDTTIIVDGTPGPDLQGPQGPAGADGEQGPAGQDGAPGADGQDGADGQAATVTVGTVTTGDPGTSAVVVNSGTSSAAVLDFTIPQGAKGDTGEKGDPGEAPADVVTSQTITEIVALTQAAYDALTPDPATLYVITDA